MPNHCENDLYVRGKRADLNKFREFCKGEGTVFDFNKFIPYPEEFTKKDKEAQLIQDAFHNMDAASCRMWLDIHGYINVMHAYDFKDGFNSGGYEWCAKNWRTKWNAYQDSIVTDNKNRLTITFQSAWSPPIPVIKKASEIFHMLEFTLKSYERGSGFQGVYKVRGGSVIEDSSREYKGSRGG